MDVYVVKVKAAEPGSRVHAGQVVTEFLTEEEAQYFRSLAERARGFRGIRLEVERASRPAPLRHFTAAA